MNYTKGQWKQQREHIYSPDNKLIATAEVREQVDWYENARLISACPDMYEALKYSAELIEVARQYFPKSIKTSDKFTLENTCATISKALAKAEGKDA